MSVGTDEWHGLGLSPLCRQLVPSASCETEFCCSMETDDWPVCTSDEMSFNLRKTLMERDRCFTSQRVLELCWVMLELAFEYCQKWYLRVNYRTGIASARTDSWECQKWHLINGGICKCLDWHLRIPDVAFENDRTGIASARTGSWECKKRYLRVQVVAFEYCQHWAFENVKAGIWGGICFLRLKGLSMGKDNAAIPQCKFEISPSVGPITNS